jgi:hypothetical protein
MHKPFENLAFRNEPPPTNTVFDAGGGQADAIIIAGQTPGREAVLKLVPA